MARILLINPPFYRLLGSHYNANSLGIAYIASVLNQAGHDAWLYNTDFVNKRTYLDLGQIFQGFHDYKLYFQDETLDIWNEITDRIESFCPDWVGYTSYTANIQAIDIISRKLKARMPRVKQVIGGVHATLDPNVLNSVPAIDYAVRREGEYAMLALLDGKAAALIPGVVSRIEGYPKEFLNKGDAEVIRDIDNLPFPEREKFYGLSDSEKEMVDVSYICSVRGCPYRCNYCASPFHWKRNKTQYRSVESIISEMNFLKNNYWGRSKEFDYSASANTLPKTELIIPDNTVVYFVDDVFTIKKPRIVKILNTMISEKIDMAWKCEARADHLDEEICDLMAKAKCVRVKIGFESGSDRILKMIQKDETREDMLHAARMLKKAGVPFTAYFMAGFPGETDDDLLQTIQFAEEIDADYYSLSVLSPYFGTKIYYDLMDQGYQLDKLPWEYFYHQSGELMVNNSISDKVLQKFLSLNTRRASAAGYV